jgi:hypothetical protein
MTVIRVARPGVRIDVYDADWETLLVDATDRTDSQERARRT